MLRDASDPVFQRFAAITSERLTELDLNRLRLAHAASPLGPHPDDLARLLNVFRAQHTLGKHVILALSGESGYRIGTITGQREHGSVTVADEVYGSIEEAEHAVFLLRLAASGLGADDDQPEETR